MRLLILFLLLSVSAFAAKNTVSLPNYKTETKASLVKKKQLIEMEDIKRFTPQIGMVISNFYGGDSDGGENVTNLSVGAALELKTANPNTTIESGLFMRTMGSEGETQGSNVEVQLRYLSLPVLGKTVFSESNTGTVYYKYGGMLNLLLSDKTTVNDVEASVDANTLDFGPAVGIGTHLKGTGPQKYELTFDATFYRGVRKTVKLPTDDIYNSALILTAGITL